MSSRKVEIENISETYAAARQGIEHAIRLLQSALAKVRYTVPRGETRAYLEMRRDLPYFIHETSIPGTQILVNRNYKPLGNSAKAGEKWVKYEEAVNMHVRLSPEQIASVVSPGRTHGLFGDENAPWFGRKEAEAYLARLNKLLLLV